MGINSRNVEEYKARLRNKLHGMTLEIDIRHSLSYVWKMEVEVFYNFDREKNKWLLKLRQINFDVIISVLDTNGPLDIIRHPNQSKYPDQQIYVVEVEGYIYLVSFIENKKEVFLKTVFPSRKMTQRYLHATG